jgi:hypothetical protein
VGGTPRERPVTSFQFISMWALRALVLWGALEAGSSLYSNGAEQLAALRRIEGHHAAMQRLEARAAAAEERNHAARERLAQHQSGVVITVTEVAGQNVGVRAAQMLRDDLVGLGAQAPVVDGTDEPISENLRRIILHATWREATETSPSILHELAARYSMMNVRALRLTRAADGSFVEVACDFDAVARVRSEAP